MAEVLNSLLPPERLTASSLRRPGPGCCYSRLLGESAKRRSLALFLSVIMIFKDANTFLKEIILTCRQSSGTKMYTIELKTEHRSENQMNQENLFMINFSKPM